jgi:hypothetical protein
MSPIYILIDFESLPLKSLATLNGEQFHVKVFLGPNNRNVPAELAVALQKMPGRGEYIVLDAPGKNALDFYITYYLGELVSKNPTAVFYVVSKDKGFDSLVKHLKARGINCNRVTALEPITNAGRTPKPKAAAPAKPPATQTTELRELVKLAVIDLTKRKAARPGTIKKLVNTIRNICGKDCPQSTVDNIISALTKQGHIKVEGSTIKYNLPPS